MLTRLKIDGFKNLVGVDIRFGPFTCIAGANGIGKSNLFDAIRFLSRCAGSPLLEAAMSVRDDSARANDVRGLFHRVGNQEAPEMRFEAEMVVPSEAVDDLGQVGKAAITFLKYTLVIRHRTDPQPALSSTPLEILKEELVHIQLGEAHEHLLFPHNKKKWRDQVVLGRRSGIAFISTASKDGKTIIKLHQDAAGGGRAYERSANLLPKTVLSSATAAESPTALCARREMQSWQLLQLEPAALRQPDEFNATPRLSANGRGLPATLFRIASQATLDSEPTSSPKTDPDLIYAKIANRLNDLIGGVASIRVDRDEKRELLTLMMQARDGTEIPARALSDGTLRFLALSVLELDPETPRVLCLEEPENGIHPDRIPAILQLLQDLAVDPTEPADPSNPLRQVIINTHSPSVVASVPIESVLLASTVRDRRDNQEFDRIVFSCLPENWRTKAPEPQALISPGQMMPYLSPLSLMPNNSHRPRGSKRVVDHPEFRIFQPQPPG